MKALCRLRFLAIAFAMPFLAGCGAKSTGNGALPVEEPRNLDLVKKDLNAYVGTGAYEREIAVATSAAQKWIEERVARRQPGEKLAVIIDVDETALSNLPELRLVGFGYLPSEWNSWIAKGEAPPLGPVLELFKATRRAGVEVIFLTGRSERSEQASTERNLKSAGYMGFNRVICNPNDGTTATTGAYKVNARRKLVAEGWTIIANVGDQESDLAGGNAERTFKLPNPFYITQ